MDYWLVKVPDEETLNELLLWPPLVQLQGFVQKHGFWNPGQYVVWVHITSPRASLPRVLELLEKNHMEYTALGQPEPQLIPWRVEAVRRFVGDR